VPPGGIPGGGAPGVAGEGRGGAPAPPVRGVRLTDIQDGTSNTLLVAEAGPPVPWTKPADIPYSRNKPLPKLDGPFGNAIHTAWADGGCTALRRDIPEKVFRHLIERADGNVFDAEKLYAPAVAFTEEEKRQTQAITRDMQDKVVALYRELAALAQEKNTLTAERAAGLDDLDKLESELRRLRELVALEKAALERLKQELKNPPREKK
jgi:hypothetical protein